MNIFVLHEDPRAAASYHCDQHVNKMILESAQILSSAARVHIAPKYWPEFYKPLQLAHPCVQWAMEDLNNCGWLVLLALGLSDERAYRIPGIAEHRSIKIIDAFSAMSGCFNRKYTPPQKFALAMPEWIRTKDTTDVHKYRLYYRHKRTLWQDKNQEMTWTNREIPEFMK